MVPYKHAESHVVKILHVTTCSRVKCGVRDGPVPCDINNVVNFLLQAVQEAAKGISADWVLWEVNNAESEVCVWNWDDCEFAAGDE